MWTAFLGLHDQSKRSAAGVQERKLKQIISHPSFNDFTYDYDIALLELEQPVEYSATVRPICLPDTSHTFPAGKAIWVTGWGHTYEGGELGCPTSHPERNRLPRSEIEALGESRACGGGALGGGRGRATSLSHAGELLKLWACFFAGKMKMKTPTPMVLGERKDAVGEILV